MNEKFVEKPKSIKLLCAIYDYRYFRAVVNGSNPQKIVEKNPEQPAAAIISSLYVRLAILAI